MKAGFCAVNITPPKHYPMGGFDLRTVENTGVHDDVFASAVVFDDGNSACAVCSVETLGVTAKIIGDIRRTVCANIPLSYESIQIGATHTHASPEAFFENAPCYDGEYYKFLVGAVANSIIKAYGALHEVSIIASNTTVDGVGSYRDRLREDSAYGMPCTTLLFRSLDEEYKDIALAAFACHPTVLNESNMLISSDLVYGFRKHFNVLRPNTDLVIVNGACADVSSRYTRTAASYDEVERLGALWAKGVADAIDGEELKDPKISVLRQNVPIPSAQFFDAEQRKEALDHLERKIGECADSQQRREYVSCRCVLVRENYGAKGGCTAELGVIKIGKLVLFSMPFEYAAVDSDALRKKLDVKFNCKSVACCYTNGYEGYLHSGRPLDKDSGYEDMASLFRHDSKLIVADAIEKLCDIAFSD